MSEQLAWALWWAFPWKYAHEDWRGDEFPATRALYNSERLVPGRLTDIAACLPPPPHLTVLRLALAPEEQLDLALALVRNTFNPEVAAPLSDSHHLWCLRLSKALPPAMLVPDADPLQLLRGWVEPATWQRLRLRFSRGRVREAETANASLNNRHSQLNTLWQAIVWRATTPASNHMPLDQTGKETSDVMPAHH